MGMVYGVGINDAGYTVRKQIECGYVNGKRKRKVVWVCPYYQMWTGLLGRCYSERNLKDYPTYIGCTVCEEWKRFSNFKAWMEQQDWEGKHLDKDILFPGNKVYSAEKCVFISPFVNTFVVECTSLRGKWPIGVYLNSNNKFQAQCQNGFTKVNEYLGSFDTPEEAHGAWLTRKLELDKLLAAEQGDPRVAKALVERYENYKLN